MKPELNGDIDSARLSERIILLRPAQPVTPAGQLPGGPRREAGWETVCAVWAEAVCVGSGVTAGDGLDQGVYDYKFCIRYREGIRRGMQIQWGDRRFEIVEPPVDWKRRKVGLTLHARELVTYGTAQK